jgi:hypothetical protein
MIVATVIVLVITTIVWALIAYFIWRNKKLYEYRIGLIDRDFDTYKNLPFYDTMLYSFMPLTDKNWAPNAKK